MSTPRPLIRLTVRSVAWLNPTIVRVTFHAPGFKHNGFSDAYVKLLFDERGPILDDPGERPPTRTYTVRFWEPTEELLTLDFVVHGAEGRAAPWAAACQLGDEVIARGPGGRWSPNPDVDFHLFIGDESSVPAIAGALERLPQGARGLVLLETTEHEVELPAPPAVGIHWIRSAAPYDPALLAREAAELDWDSFGDVEIFAHGEREAIKVLRPILSAKVSDRSRLSISGYWAYGRAEDQFQAEKKTSIGQI